jgi:hypothetical protein
MYCKERLVRIALERDKKNLALILSNPAEKSNIQYVKTEK